MEIVRTNNISQQRLASMSSLQGRDKKPSTPRSLLARTKDLTPISTPKPSRHTTPMTSMVSMGSMGATSQVSSNAGGGAYEEFARQMDHQMHRIRVETMRPDTDTKAPKTYPHLSENLKGKQQVADEKKELERLNTMMEQRLQSMPNFGKAKVAQLSKRPRDVLNWPEKMERACLTGDSPLLNQALFHVGHEDMLRGGWFPVTLAAAAGHAAILAELLKLGADPVRRMPDRSTPLRLASAAGRVECVHELLKVYAEGEIQAACEQASNNGKLAVVKRLFDHRGALVYSLPHGCIQRLCTSVEVRTHQRKETRANPTASPPPPLHSRRVLESFRGVRCD
jgi:hypothetical protein